MTTAALAPPRFDPTLCASSRHGLQGCHACRDVCPHEALGFGKAGPGIDPEVCQRCGACTAACPVGALERAYLPAAELDALVLAAVAQRPALLIVTCGHSPGDETGPTAGDIRLLRLPCVQLVSDDFLLLAVTAGASAVRIQADSGCPHRPHVGVERSVEAAGATLQALGLGEWRVVLASPDDDSTTALVAQAREQALRAVGLPDLGNKSRFERRAALVAALVGSGMTSTRPAAPAVPWRRPEVQAARCTLCSSCAQVCPTGALLVGRDGATLFSHESACIGCTLCEKVCPEDALSLRPVVPRDEKIRPVAHQPLAKCLQCGKPIGPEAAVARVEQTLARTGTGDRSTVRLCESCKDARVFQRAEVRTGHESSRGPSPRSVSLPLVSNGPAPAQPEPPATQPAPSRRGFLGQLGAAAGAAVVAGCSAGQLPAASESKHRYGMVIDTQRCIGCRACVLACKAENKTPPGVNYILVTENLLGPRPDDKPVFTPKPCFHCEHPPCVDVCPVSATFKRKDDGIVVMDYDRCIGCRYCQTACPYAARYFDFGENYQAMIGDSLYAQQVPSPEYRQFRQRSEGASPIDNVRKCMFCMHLQDENGDYDQAAGLWPACAKTCPGHAIHFGDFKDRESDVSRLVRERQTIRAKEELGAEPNVHYLF